MNSEVPVPEKDPREQAARLRELLAIPERQRTDAQWDEIIDIEINLGPKKPSGNQAPRQDAGDPRRQQPKRPGNKPTVVGKHLRKHRP